jgi:hypothetical protein
MSEKTAKRAAKTANTMPCCPRLPIPIPTSLIATFAGDVGALWFRLQAIAAIGAGQSGEEVGDK